MCYGWPTPTDLSNNHLYKALIDALGPDATRRLVHGAFEVAELFVHSGARGCGFGRSLLSAATADRSTAWLITSPRVPAARLYQHLGWRQITLLPADFYPQLPLAVFGRTEINRHDGCGTLVESNRDAASLSAADFTTDGRLRPSDRQLLYGSL